ncbi:MAG TPA: RDD family protein [Candidatus Limnocylindrales bacterium]|nr:RDD family protein [Candidatus Limnocylindrales bacterium]
MTGPGPSDPGDQAPTPAAPEAAPGAPANAAGGSNWSEQGQTPDWAQKAQDWRPAAVAAGPAAGIEYADLTNRIIAFIIDAVIIGVIGFVIWLVFGALFLASLLTGGGFLFFILAVAVLVLQVVLAGVYFIYTWTNLKASPGQRILGMMTVSETDGSALTFNQALARFVIMIAPWYIGALSQYIFPGILGFILGFAGLAWTIYLVYTTANDPKRQGFHDKYAHSVVIKPSAVTAPPSA